MEHRPIDPEAVYVPARKVRQRYGDISDMSLWRWLNNEALKFPQPIRINNRRLWKLAELERWEAERAPETEAA